MEKVWNFSKYNHNIAMIDENGCALSFLELEKLSGKFFGYAGQRRCLAFILCSNTIGSIVSYISCVNNGIVPLLLNSEIDIEFFNKIYALYKPRLLIMPKYYIPKINQLGYGRESTASFQIKDYFVFINNKNPEIQMNEDLALLLSTSGSTGSPKFVRQSYKNIISNANAIKEYLRLNETERPITTLPMNYTYGLSVINSHLMAGAMILVTGKSLMQKEFWTFFKENGATSFSGVPYTYEMLDKLRFTRMRLPSLRTMTQAGGKLSLELHKKFAEYANESGKKFVVMYGQCEATARMGYLPAEKSIEKIGSMGIAIPGGRFSLVDDSGIEINGCDIIGELVYEGDNVTLGYAESKDDLKLNDMNNGKLFTGDMAKRDADGYYYIVGRKKRFLKIYGNKVNLDELERMIKAQFKINDLVCGGEDDRLLFFATDKDRIEDIRSFAAEKTHINPAAFFGVYLDSIPRNDAGKILYRELEKYYYGKQKS